MKKIIDWFKESNRGLHLLLGVVVGLLPTGWWNTEVLAAGVAGSMEFKDWQWGGGTIGSASYNSDNEQGESRMGGGGGASDIRLSDGSLYSRMIVAGGGSGGGRGFSRVTMNAVKSSGGGSGWVNTAASAGNRPSGYTGLELASGETYAGNTSFPAPGGGNETGHSGDGYIRITRIS